MGSRKLIKFMGAGAVACVLALGTPSLVSAATPAGYPGSTTTTTAPTTTTTPPSVVVVTNGSTVTITVGGTTSVSLGGFAPGSTMTSVTINGVVVTVSLAADASGNLIFAIVVTDPHISINGSAPIPAVVGNNSITLTGTQPDGTTVTKTILVSIPTAGTTAAGTSSNGSSGTLAFTGADIAATVVGGLALLAAGTLLVIFTRRRAGSQHPV
jgi:hypothetical protein